MKITLQTLPEPGRMRQMVHDPDGSVTDIIEGPARWILLRLVLQFVGDKFSIRKVRK